MGELSLEEYPNLDIAAADLLQACLDFVAKVESGQARSRRSYAQMKAAIKKAEATDWVVKPQDY